MSTAQALITRMYRELNVVAIGVTPNAAQLQEGLDRTNDMLRIIFGSEMGELLVDWDVPYPQRTAPVAANFPQNPYPLNGDFGFMGMPLSGGSSNIFPPYPPKNSRIVFGGTQATTVWFPEQPDDGSRMGVIQGSQAGTGVVLTLDGNGRTIGGQPTQTYTTPLARMRWIYRADLGDWRPIASVALTDEMPFPEDMDDYFVTRGAIRLAPANDKTVSAETAAAYKDAKRIFDARYKQSGTTTFGAAEIPTGYQSYLGGHYWL